MSDKKNCLYWLPYLSFNTGICDQAHLEISCATLMPDNANTWRTLNISRPLWFSTFRDFPPAITPTIEGPELFGSLLYSPNVEWLDEHVSKIVSLIYLLGEPTSREIPADRFRYLRVGLNPMNPDLSRYRPKKGEFWESSDSIRVYPPLELRAQLDKLRLHMNDAWKSEAIAFFNANPSHRIFVAVEHYFRTQFSDPFLTPTIEDTAHICGCLEAACDLDSDSGSIGDKVSSLVSSIYNNDEKLKRWMQGLYSARSIHVHGISLSSADDADQRIKAYKLFVATPGRMTLAYNICKDILMRKLYGYASAPRACLLFSAEDDVQRFLHSDQLLSSLCKYLTRCKASDKLTLLVKEHRNRPEQDGSNDPYYEFYELAHRFVDSFDWKFVNSNDNEKRIFAILRTIALVITKLFSPTSREFTLGDSLGKATDTGDKKRLKQWRRENSDRRTTFLPDDVCELFTALALKCIEYFDASDD